MKKIIGFIGAYFFLYIGEFVCWLSYRKRKRAYIFDDTRFERIGFYLASWYQSCMMKSLNIQDWAGLSKPWKEVKDENH